MNNTCKRRRTAAAAIVGSTLVLVGSCVHPPFTEQKSVVGYPVLIGRIMTSECAISGCHDQQSNEAAASLDLSTWEAAMRGSRNNASIIPFSPEQSPFLFIVNHFEDLGPTLSPTMPYGRDALSRNEVLLIQDWIERGAPSADGEIAFEDVTIDQQLLVLNSLCRQVSILDLASGLLMRYVQLDTNQDLGFAERIIVHPTLPHWYVLFTNGRIEQHDAYGGALQQSAQLGIGSWRTMELKNNGDELWIMNWAGNSDLEGGQLARIDARTMQVLDVESFAGDSVYFPLSLACTDGDSLCYSASYLGNFTYKMSLSGSDPVVEKVPLGEDPVAFNTSAYRPAYVTVDPASQDYYVASERSEDVRRFDGQTDELEAVIPVGFFPQRMLIDAQHQRLFVSCVEDIETFPGSKSAIYVIDLQSNTVKKTLYAGYQSRAMYLDDQRGWLYVANRNVDPTGADEPHHYTDCAGKNGYLTRINLNTLEVDPGYRAELSVDPYDLTGR